jgi:hypothetical protein
MSAARLRALAGEETAAKVAPCDVKAVVAAIETSTHGEKLMCTCATHTHTSSDCGAAFIRMVAAAAQAEVPHAEGVQTIRPEHVIAALAKLGYPHAAEFQVADETKRPAKAARAAAVKQKKGEEEEQDDAPRQRKKRQRK